MTTLHLPDVSEFQPNVDFAKVAAHNGGAAIIRVYNGYRPDNAWRGGVRRRIAHRKGIRVLGLYAYLVADRSLGAQISEFCALVGKLQPGEFAVLDFEDPKFAGSRIADAKTWLTLVDRRLRYDGYHGSWLYSYGSFASAHGLLPIFASHRPTWLAAYGPTEPRTPGHSLWQHSDAEAWPGIGRCDCSIFHGDVAALAARVWTRPDGKPHHPSPAPKPVVHPKVTPVTARHRPLNRRERSLLRRLLVLLRHGRLGRAIALIRVMLTGKA